MHRTRTCSRLQGMTDRAERLVEDLAGQHFQRIGFIRLGDGVILDGVHDCPTKKV
jgi:hypothetical protein